MAPQIGASITAGFRTANKSWLGIGLYAAGWVLIGLVGLGSVLLTRPPAEVFEEPTVTTPDFLPPLESEPVVEPLPEGLVTDPDLPSDLTIPEPEPEFDFTTPSTAAQEQAVEDWFGRAWPVLLFFVLLYIVAYTWLTGGQLGYTTKLVRTQIATANDFVASGKQHFVHLLGAMGVSLGIALVVFGIMLLAGSVGATNQTASTVVAVVVLVPLVIGMIWLGVRLAFWWLAIVADQLGPITALKASFRATKGRWWKTFLLLLLLGLINAGASFVFRVIMFTGGQIGGAAGVVFLILGVIPLIIWSLYFAFLFAAASLRFYDDMKATATV